MTSHSVSTPLVFPLLRHTISSSQFAALKKARQNAPPNTIFVFCGDGVSDISAAQHADILFARHGRDLEAYCRRENVPFRGFDTFTEVEEIVEKLVNGKVTLQRDEKTGFCSLIDA